MKAYPVEAVARPPAGDPVLIKQYLDIGFRSLLIPMVESVAQARMLVAATRFPPHGMRGVASATSRASGFGANAKYLENTHGEICLVVQIESAAGLHAIEEIAAVEGVAALWVGQFDLSNFLGIPGQFSNPQFLGALERVIAACRKYNKFPCYMALSLPEAEARLRDGFKCLAYGGDLWLYQSALQSGLESIRSLLRFEH